MRIDSEWRRHPRDGGHSSRALVCASDAGSRRTSVAGLARSKGLVPRFPPSDPTFPLVRYDGRGNGLTGRTADRAVPVKLHDHDPITSIVRPEHADRERPACDGPNTLTGQYVGVQPRAPRDLASGCRSGKDRGPDGDPAIPVSRPRARERHVQDHEAENEAMGNPKRRTLATGTPGLPICSSPRRPSIAHPRGPPAIWSVPPPRGPRRERPRTRRCP